MVFNHFILFGITDCSPLNFTTKISDILELEQLKFLLDIFNELFNLETKYLSILYPTCPTVFNVRFLLPKIWELEKNEIK